MIAVMGAVSELGGMGKYGVRGLCYGRMECDGCLADAMFYDWSITFCKAFAQQKVTSHSAISLKSIPKFLTGSLNKICPI